MFDFFELSNFGREITAHGEQWQSVKYFQDGYHLAVKKYGICPTQCFMVKEDEKIPAVVNQDTA